ncbi:MAG: hypothetical protein HN348_24325, partial [Proteobacteria bacterium]|nr:hypothetical protein [Pseudomonadota bacterium]
MTWADLLSKDEETTLPWTGGRSIFSSQRSWAIKGQLPEEFGWHRFVVAGSRQATWVGPGEADPVFDEGRPTKKGYLVGNRLISDDVGVRFKLDALFEQTLAV